MVDGACQELPPLRIGCLDNKFISFFICCFQIKDGFGEGKDLVVTVMSAMGEEQICALKDIGPKN